MKMLTSIAVVALVSAYLTHENHPHFQCPSDPIEREWYAQIWRSRQIKNAWQYLGLAILIEGGFMAGYTVFA